MVLDPLLTFWKRRFQPSDQLAPLIEELESGGSEEKVTSALLSAAASGNTFAMCRLSVHYSNPESAAFSPERALALARQAADLDFAPGHFLVGWYLEIGFGAAKDLLSARDHYELSAKGGYGVAALHLAEAMEDGRFGTLDSRAVIDFLSRAAFEGDSACAMRLGSWSERGNHVVQDIETARKWYERASDHGSTLGSLRLARAYANGELGLRRDMYKHAEYLERSQQGDLG
ncbi:MAG: tetratricopeptide repeat protein [Terriglobia bacterium]